MGAEDAELRVLLAPLIALAGTMEHWPLDAIVVQCGDAKLTVKQLLRIRYIASAVEDALAATPSSQIEAVITGPNNAKTKADWDAAWIAIRELYDRTPFCTRLGVIKLRYYGNYPLRSAIGSAGVLAIAQELL